MGLKQRRGTDGPKSNAADSKTKREKDFATVKKLGQVRLAVCLSFCLSKYEDHFVFMSTLRRAPLPPAATPHTRVRLTTPVFFPFRFSC
jgi:hypothetical protein